MLDTHSLIKEQPAPSPPQQQKLEGKVTALENTIKSLEEKLRALEDMELVTKLEGIQVRDDFATAKFSLGELKEKVDVLSDAVKGLAKIKVPGKVAALEKVVAKEEKPIEKLAERIAPAELPSPVMKNLEDIIANVSALTQRIETVEKMAATEKDLSALQSSVQSSISSLKSGLDKANANIQSVSDSIKQQIDAYEKRVYEKVSKDIKITADAIRNEIGSVSKDVQSAVSFTKERFATEEKRFSFIDEQLKKLQAFGSEAKSAKWKVDELSKAFDEVQESVKNYSQAIDKISRAVDKALAQQKSEMRASLSEFDQKLLSSLKSTQKNLQNLNNEIQDVKASLIRISKEAEGYGAEVSELQRTISSADLRTFLNKIPEFYKLDQRVETLSKLNNYLVDQISTHTATLDEVKRIADSFAGVKKEFSTFKSSFDPTIQQLRQSVARANQRIEDLKSLTVDMNALKTDMAGTRGDLATVESRLRADFGARALQLGEELNAVKKTYTSIQNSIQRIRSDMEPIKKIEDWVADRVGKYEASARQIQQNIIADFSKYSQRIKATMDELDSKFAKLGKSTDQKISELDASFADLSKSADKKISELDTGFADLSKSIAERAEETNKMIEQRLNGVEKSASQKIAEISGVTDEKLVALEKRASERIDELSKSLKAEIESSVGESVLGDIRKDVGLLKNEVDVLKGIRSELVADVENILAGQEEQILKKIAFEPMKKELFEKVNNKVSQVDVAIDSLKDIDKDLRAKVEAVDKKVNELATSVEEAIAKAVETRLAALERENTTLKQELERLKSSYFEIAEERKLAPLIIE